MFDECSDSILQAWLPGEEGGTAIAKAIFGKINPSGKLPISFPRSVGQIPVFYNHKASGQRSHWFGDYVDGSPKPLYPFGFGMTYTKFEYSSLEIKDQFDISAEEIQIKFKLKNVGKKSGEEIVQLYVNDSAASVTRPVKELKGFGKIALKPGDEKNLRFNLPFELLSFFDNNMDLCIEPGKFKIMIGSSSDNILLEKEILVTGEKRIIKKRTKYSTGFKIE